MKTFVHFMIFSATKLYFKLLCFSFPENADHFDYYYFVLSSKMIIITVDCLDDLIWDHY